MYNCVERSRLVKTVGVDSHQKGSNTITGRLNYPRGDASRFDRMGLKRGSLMANHRFTGRAVVEVVRLRNRSHGVTSNVIFHEVYEAAISILGNAYTWRHRFQRRASNRAGNSPLSPSTTSFHLPASFANCRLLKKTAVTMLSRRGGVLPSGVSTLFNDPFQVISPPSPPSALFRESSTKMFLRAPFLPFSRRFFFFLPVARELMELSILEEFLFNSVNKYRVEILAWRIVHYENL